MTLAIPSTKSNKTLRVFDSCNKKSKFTQTGTVNLQVLEDY